MSVLLATAGCVAGCGGDEGGGNESASTAPAKTTPVEAPPKPPSKAPDIGPEPAETPEEALARLGTAGPEECKSAEELFYGAERFSPAECRELLKSVVPKRLQGVRAYRSAAVVEDEDGSLGIFTLDRKGRYRFATKFGPLPDAPPEAAVDAMGASFSAIQRDNCEDLLPWAQQYTPGGEGEEFCALLGIRQLHDALAEDADAKPVLLGADNGVVFYGVETKTKGYFTLLYAAADPQTYLFVNSYPAE
jgi:hypothetical protein